MTAEDTQRLWQQHKYSVQARPQTAGGLRNAVEHMWGHVSGRAECSREAIGDDTIRDIAFSV